jgi:hypothetical protein
MCFISALAILTFIKYSKTKQKKYLFLLGLSFGLAPTTHLQGVLLIIVLPIFLLTLKIKDVKSWAILILGLIIPTIPLIIFDFRNNFVNSLGLINYLLHGQYKTSYDALGRRWSTYLTVFWPHAWALIIGGYTAIAYLTGLLFSLLLIEKIFKRDINKLWIALAGSLILIAIAMRYVRNPLFDSYLVFLHPFILLFSALAIFWLWKKNLYLGLLLLLLLAIGSLRQDYSIILNSTNTTAAIASSWQNTLVHKYPNQKFAIYDYNYKAAGYSLPLSLYLESQNKLDDNGLKIGIMQATKGAMLQFSALPTINSGNDNYQIFDMNSSNSAELIKNGWVSVNPSSVYKAVEDWHKNK